MNSGKIPKFSFWKFSNVFSKSRLAQVQFDLAEKSIYEHSYDSEDHAIVLKVELGDESWTQSLEYYDDTVIKRATISNGTDKAQVKLFLRDRNLSTEP